MDEQTIMQVLETICMGMNDIGQEFKGVVRKNNEWHCEFLAYTVVLTNEQINSASIETLHGLIALSVVRGQSKGSE